MSPFARYGLLRNPFGELTRGERAELAIVELRSWLEFLREPRAALQFIGPCGHGKTTHLLAMEKALNEQSSVPVPFVYFPEDGSQPKLPSSRPIIVDEAQRMKFFRKRQLLRSGGPLVLSTHVDLTRDLQRSGFHVRTVDVGLPKSAEAVLSMLEARLQAARLHRPTQANAASECSEFSIDLSPAQVVAWLDRFGSNIRALEHYLYADLQQAVREGKPWPTATS